ncbi:MAG: orotate phosphoribosyltransferase [Actinomycetota bacterium]|nr:orotate phosphoribosyltransferase [Actinomycetota bacterium]
MIKVINEVKGTNLFKILKDTGSIMEGHFQLTSGYHSNYYLQCARLLQYPGITFKLANKGLGVIKEKVELNKVNTVVSPAVGGIQWGYMLAYAGGYRMVFAERKNKKMELRRGFEIKKDEEIIVAEDVVTTGGSVSEVIDICKGYGAKVKAVVSIVDRSENLKFECPYYYLINLNIDKYPPSRCELCRKNYPLEYPGSRKKF